MPSNRTQKPRAARALPADVQAALRDAVTRLKTQTAVAKALQVSSPVVSQLLSDSYLGDVDGIAERIRGAFMAATVQCPVMGMLGRDHCLQYQRRKPAFTNPVRAALYTACKTCPNRREAS